MVEDKPPVVIEDKIPLMNAAKLHSAETKTPRLKNPVVAAVLGFFFAPFSALYFGWRILFITLLAVSLIGIAFAFVLYLTPFKCPPWLPWSVGVFYAIWNAHFACHQNHTLQADEESWCLESWCLPVFFVYYLAAMVAVYNSFLFVREGRYFAALACVMIMLPLAHLVYICITLLLGLLLGLLMPLLWLFGLASGAPKHGKRTG